MARAPPSHTHASRLPQQQQQLPARSSVGLRPNAPHPPSRQHHKSAALSAVASLPASTRSPASSSSYLSSSNVHVPISSDPMPNDDPAVTNGAQPLLHQTNASPHPCPNSGLFDRAADLPALNTNLRSASGSLDRIASVPVYSVNIKPESLTSSGSDAPRNIAPETAESTKVSRVQSGSQSAALPSGASFPQQLVPPAGPPSTPTVPSQDGLTNRSPAQGKGQSFPQAHGRQQVQDPRRSHRPPARSPQQCNPGSTTQTAPSAASPKTLLSPAAALNRSEARLFPRALSHVDITDSVVHASTPSRVQANVTSPNVATSPRAKSRTALSQAPSHASPRSSMVVATPQKTRTLAPSDAVEPSAAAGPSHQPERSSVPSQLSPKRRRITQIQLQASTEASSSVPAATLHTTSNATSTHGPSTPHEISIKSKDPAASVASRSVARQCSSNNTGSANPVEDSDPLRELRGSFLTSTEPLDYDELMAKAGGNLKTIPVVSCLEATEEELQELIVDLVENSGEPLIISDLHKTAAWSADLFTPQSYAQLKPSKEPDGETVWIHNLTDWMDRPLPLPDFLAHCEKETKYAPEQKEKLYGKDLPCPPEWTAALAKLVHPRLEYHGEQDLSASLTEKARSVTMMCYFGPGHTCTPLHRDLCSSLGQDLMVWSDPGASSIWMITHPADAEAVDEYIASKGGDPLTEGFAPHPNELLDAPFPIFCHKQSVGDLVLIPSRASRMVLNTGGRTMKAAWDRLTAETLASALSTDLPVYQRLCRKECYHVKPVIEETLIKFTLQIESNIEKGLETTSQKIRDLRGLLQLYDAILTDEYLPDWRNIKLEGDKNSYVECDFCGADVLHGFFECPAEHTLCSHCYSQGRLCSCVDAATDLKPHQHWRNFGERLQLRNHAARTLLEVQPTLASTTDSTTNAGTDPDEDDEDQEPPLRPVEILAEDDYAKKTWPFGFMAAVKLYKIRETPGWKQDLAPCRICKATLDLSQRYHCKPCRHSYCYGCLLHKMYIHPVHTLAQKEPELFHRYHRKASTLDYKEWKQDPLQFHDEARAHFALIESARVHTKCEPNYPGCRIGFLDVSEEHPHGLSGMLGVRRSNKAATGKAKVAAAASGSTPSATPGARKRPNDSVQPPTIASPKLATNKRAKLGSASDVVPMEEDRSAEQGLQAQQGVDVWITAAAPVQLPRPATHVADIPMRSLIQEDDGPFAAPTVANGIRKYKLRKGLAQPMSPISTIGSSPVSSPSSQAFVQSNPTPNEPNLKESTSGIISSPFLPASIVQQPTADLPEPSKTKAKPIESTITTAIQSSREALSAELTTTAVAFASRSTVSNPAVASAKTTTAPIPAPVAASSASPPVALSPPRTAQGAVAPATEQGRPAAESLAIATGIVGPELATRPATSTTTASEPTSGVAGLGALDSMNLRVITEILRIFSQSNQKMIAEQMEKLGKLQANQAEEHEKALAKQAAEHKKARDKQAEEAKQALANVEATLLQRIDQLSSQLQEQTHHYESMTRDLRMEVETKTRQTEGLEERIKEVETVLGGLMEDIEQGVQLELEAERAEPSASDAAATSGLASTSNRFAPTSHARLQR